MSVVNEPQGNAAAMREAMIEVLEYIETFHKYITPGKGKKLTALFAVADTIRDKARAALSAPPRNCDVGTAEEQTERFKQLCRKYRRGPGPRTNCKGCPISRESQHVGCTFGWAQMPYEEGGAK